jgi:hypothetical protein
VLEATMTEKLFFRLALLVLHPVFLGAHAGPLLQLFSAEDVECVGAPLESFPVAEGNHFLDAPQVGLGNGKVHFKCTGDTLIASLAPGDYWQPDPLESPEIASAPMELLESYEPGTAGWQDTEWAGGSLGLTRGADLCQLASNDVFELADGGCLPGGTTLTSGTSSSPVNVKLSETMLLPRRTGCIRSKAIAEARKLAIAEARKLAKGAGGSSTSVSSGTIVKREIPDGPGSFFGAVCLSIFFGLWLVVAIGLAVANKLVGHKFVAKGAKSELDDDEGE